MDRIRQDGWLPGRQITGRSSRGNGAMRWALAWAVGAALVSAAAVWWLMPRTPSASGVATSALHAATSGVTSSQITERIEQAIPADARVIVGLGRQPTATVIPGSSSGVAVIPGTMTSPSPGSAVNPGPGSGTNPDSNTAASPSPSVVSTPASQLGPSSARQSQVTILAGTAAASTLISKQEGYSETTAVALSPTGTWVMAAVPSPNGIRTVLVAAGVAMLAGLGGVLLGLTRRDTRTITQSVPAPTDTAGTEPDRELQRLRAQSQQRTVLVRKLAELLPQMPESLAWQASKALNEAGVRAFVPDGEPFDPAFHHAVGTEPAASGLENTVARTIRPGYRDSQQVLVYPKVVVYVDANERDSYERH